MVRTPSLLHPTLFPSPRGFTQFPPISVLGLGMETECLELTANFTLFWLRDFSLVLPQPQGLIAIGKASFGLAKDHLRASRDQDWRSASFSSGETEEEFYQTPYLPKTTGARHGSKSSLCGEGSPFPFFSDSSCQQNEV